MHLQDKQEQHTHVAVSMATQRKREGGRWGGGEGRSCEEEELGGVEVFGRLEGLLPPRRCRHCVEWVKGLNPPPPSHPREVSQTMAVPNVLPHERRKKKKEEEGACKEREAASGKIFCDGSSGEWWGERGGVGVRPARCLLRLPLPGNWSSSWRVAHCGSHIQMTEHRGLRTIELHSIIIQ